MIVLRAVYLVLRLGMLLTRLLGLLGGLVALLVVVGVAAIVMSQ